MVDNVGRYSALFLADAAFGLIIHCLSLLVMTVFFVFQPMERISFVRKPLEEREKSVDTNRSGVN